MNDLARLARAVDKAAADIPLVRIGGHVRDVAPNLFQVRGLSKFAKLGDRIRIAAANGQVLGEVVRVGEQATTVKPFDGRAAVGIGATAYLAGASTLHPDPSWKGRVINALGEPIDGAGTIVCGDDPVAVDGDPPAAMTRQRIEAPLRTGVRVIDLFMPLSRGQRIGIFAGSGVGKSTLLSMLARSADFDTVVVALVGERGREVREFLEGPLKENQNRAVTVVATGDESPGMRKLALRSATAIAEYFRDRGDSVLLIADSVTRYAHAARDVALAAGEPPVTRGYTPSVFSELPRLLERAGPGREGSGSITGVFAVLVDGDDHNDPVADAIRGTLDGHVVLRRAIADEGRYPAVDILGSVSRLADIAWSPDQRTLVQTLKKLVARYEDTRDLRLMGGYQAGSDPELDRAVAMVPRLYDALRQGPQDPHSADVFTDVAQLLKA